MAEVALAYNVALEVLGAADGMLVAHNIVEAVHTLLGAVGALADALCHSTNFALPPAAQ